VATDVSGTGGGIQLAGGDQLQSLKAFSTAGVGCLQGSAPQVFQRLSPLGKLDNNHQPPPALVLVEVILRNSVKGRSENENSASHSDLGLGVPSVYTLGY